MSKIEIKNVYKIFGDQTSKVLPMVQDGATKEEILEKTGHTVGLDNVSISIRASFAIRSRNFRTYFLNSFLSTSEVVSSRT